MARLVERLPIGLLLCIGLASPSAEAQTPGSSYLAMGNFLRKNEYISSPRGTAYATMDPNGNFSVYMGAGPWAKGQVLFNTGTGFYADTPTFTQLQSDGNLCVYKGVDPGHIQGGALWCAFSNGGSAPYVLVMQDNGSLGVFNGSSPPTTVTTPRWATPPPPPFAVTVSPSPLGGHVFDTSSTALFCGAGPGGPGQYKNCSATYPLGTVMTLRASLESGATWGSWSGPCSGSDHADCRFTVTGNTTIGATFPSVGFVTLTLAPSVGGKLWTGSLICSPAFGDKTAATSCRGTYTKGQAIAIYAESWTSSLPHNWSGCANVVNNGRECDITLTGDTTIGASF